MAKKKNVAKRTLARRNEKRAERDNRMPRSSLAQVSRSPQAFFAQQLPALLRALAEEPRLLGPEMWPTSFDEMQLLTLVRGPANLDDAIKWRAAVLLYHSARLNRFHECAERFQAALLTRDAIKGDEILARIREEFGVSLWWLRSRLQLAALCGGLASLREAAAHAEGETSEGLQICASLFSSKLDPDSSLNDFAYTVDRTLALGANRQTILAQKIVEYFRFQVDSLDLLRSVDPFDLLAFGSRLPAIDQYMMFLALAQRICTTTGAIGTAALRRSIGHLAGAFSDVRFGLLATLLSSDGTRTLPIPPSRLVTAIDGYTRGDYDTVVSLCLGEIDGGTCAFEFYELCAKSLFFIERSPIVLASEADGLSRRILAALHEVLKQDRDVANAIVTLEKCACLLEGSRFASQLNAFLKMQSRAVTACNSSRYFLLNSCCVTPRFVEISSRPYVREKILQDLSAHWPSSPSIRLFSRGADMVLDVEPVRSLKYSARLAATEGRHEDAIQTFSGALTQARPDTPMYFEIADALFASYISTNRQCEALLLLVNTYGRRPPLFAGLLIADLLRPGYRRSVFKHIFSRLEWPLAFRILAAAGEGSSSDVNRRQYGAYADFLASHGATRPTQLAYREWAARNPGFKFVSFLRFVCVPEVMDSSVAFENSEEIERERITICQTLLEIDPTNGDTYAQEIARRTQTMAVRRALNYLGDSKIYVDTDGVVRALEPTFRMGFERFLKMRELSQRHRRIVVMRSVENGSRIVVDFRDLAQETFEELFLELKNRFISSNEFGLDSYLSVRLRHGTLSAQIRRCFERDKLITQRNATTNEYEPNMEWIDRLALSPTDDKRSVYSDAFRRFAHAVDAAISEVIKQWIQIRSDATPTGMFDFNYRDEDITAVYKSVGLMKEFDSFVSVCLAELWKRTEVSLARIRERLNSELRRRLSEALAALESDVGPGFRECLSALKRATAQCRTELSHDLDAIVSWFRRSDTTSVPDYEIQQLTETAIEIVRNCHPQVRFSPAVDVPRNSRVLGRFFSAFVDVLFIVFDNVVRHSGSMEPKVQFRLSFLRNTVELSVTNVLSVEASARLTPEKLEQIRDLAGASSTARDSIRFEGGTGFVKLRKLLFYDLKRAEEAELKVKLLDGGATFQVLMQVSSGGLFV